MEKKLFGKTDRDRMNMMKTHSQTATVQILYTTQSINSNTYVIPAQVNTSAVQRERHKQFTFQTPRKAPERGHVLKPPVTDEL